VRALCTDSRRHGEGRVLSRALPIPLWVGRPGEFPFLSGLRGPFGAKVLENWRFKSSLGHYSRGSPNRSPIGLFSVLAALKADPSITSTSTRHPSVSGTVRVESPSVLCYDPTCFNTRRVVSAFNGYRGRYSDNSRDF